MPASATEQGFPLLVRLHRDFFPFHQAQPDGRDLRFATPQGVELPHEIEQWDPAAGSASIWVRIPEIRGHSRQELRVCWGNPAANNTSNPTAVFSASNGFASVWHMTGPVTDVVGTLPSKDTGTKPTQGIVGAARGFSGGHGIFGGNRIPNYPSGASPHSSAAWVRAERPNVTILGWGNEGGGRGSKVRMQLRSPPHLHIDSDFSDVKGHRRLPLGDWMHVVHTYSDGRGSLYINGQLDATDTPRLNIKSPARLWLGGWYDDYDFIGALDEVRISRVARSANWIRMEYENQKPNQTLAGWIVPPGSRFSVSPRRLRINEGTRQTVRGEAGGALKVFWILQGDGQESIVATDRTSYEFAAGRVSGHQSATLRFKAIYPNRTVTRDIPIEIREDIADPIFTLQAPPQWDGRQPFSLRPQIVNQPQLTAKGAADITTQWELSPIAVTRVQTSNTLEVLRAHKSGRLQITAILNNGGTPVRRTVEIQVTEPDREEPLVSSPSAQGSANTATLTPTMEERPVDNQFIARGPLEQGELIYRGQLDRPAESVFLTLYADDKVYARERKPIESGGKYHFHVRLRPGLIKYRAELGMTLAGQETLLQTATNIVCGDAYVLQGQSNAVATDWGDKKPNYHSEWIRTYGSMTGDPNAVHRWGEAVYRGHDTEEFQIGYWGMELARHLVETHRIPICILNGAVGGSRIDQHQRNRTQPLDTTTHYGRLLKRVTDARLNRGIRAILWYQGENDQGADGPSGGFGWETYRENFIQLATAWKQDYPNIERYYVFQIWPKSCSMGVDGSDNRLREVQRRLPEAFSRLRLMSTLGIQPPGGCHYPAAGYAAIAKLIAPLVEQDFYGKTFPHPVTPPNLQRAAFVDHTRTRLALTFDQPVVWSPGLAKEFTMNGPSASIVSGAAIDNTLVLQFTAPSNASTITYLDSKSWSPKNLLRGANGIAALTFCEVPIEPPAGN